MAINESLQRAIETLQLVDVSLSKVESNIQEGSFPAINIPNTARFQLKRPRTVIAQPFEPESSGSRRIQFHVEAGVRIFQPGEGEIPELDEAARLELLIATIETTFIATYDEGEGGPLSEDEISAFGTHNVPFNIWPYWREIVHALSSRMGLPKVVLPLYRMKKVRPPEQNKSLPSETADEPK